VECKENEQNLFIFTGFIAICNGQQVACLMGCVSSCPVNTIAMQNNLLATGSWLQDVA
jgi:ferredoxin